MFIPPEGLSFEPPIKIFNLSGGISCLYGNNRLCFLVAPIKQPKFWTELGDWMTPSALSDVGALRFLTQYYYSHAEKLHDPFPEACTLVQTDGHGAPFDRAQFERWSGISIALQKRGEHGRAVRAKRIASQILLCVHTLDRLVESYRQTLLANISDKVTRPEAQEYSFTSDIFSMRISYDTQSCLNELFSLRDSLFTFLFEDMYLEERYAWKKLEGLLLCNDRFDLASLILPATSRNNPVGKIALFSIYRNVFSHCLGPNGGPLGSPMYTFRQCDTSLGEIPYVLFPLYDDLEYLMSVEKGGNLNIAGDLNTEAIRFMTASTHVDALDFCHDSLILLLRIAQAIEASSGIPSEFQKLEEKDIIEIEVRDTDGTVRRMRRNELGKLEEY
jgi:hypothetical protein